MYYIRHIQNSGIFRTLFIQAYSRIVSIIKAYSRLFIFRLIKAYSTPFITYAYSQPFLVQALACLELEAYLKPYETLARHIQNTVIVRTVTTVYSGIIQPYSVIFRTLSNIYIWRNLAYSESWNIQNPSITVAQCIFRTLPYLRK